MKKSSRLIFIASLLFLSAQVAVAQDTLTGKNIDISKIQFQKNIFRFVTSAFIEKNITIDKAFSDVNFYQGVEFSGVIPNKYVTKKLLLRFNVSNTADSTVSVFFFPGFYYNQITLYKQLSGSLEKLPAILPPVEDSIGFYNITLQASDTANIIAELSFVKTYNNTIRPKLINKNYVLNFLI